MQSLGGFIKRSQPSLFWCMRGIKRANREAVFTVLAFCQHLDSIARSTMSPADKKDWLNTWREELDNIYDKKVPTTNIGRKIYKNCIRFDLPKSAWEKILNAAFLEASDTHFLPSAEIYEQYVDGVAVTPLHLLLMIVTPEHPRANQELAKSLGYAVFITATLRYVKDDAKRNRMYIPQEILQQAGVKIEDPRDMIEDKNLPLAREEISKQAEIGLNKAERLLSKMDKKCTLPLRLMLNKTRAMFDIMQKRGWEIISPKPKLNWPKRMYILYRTIFK